MKDAKEAASSADDRASSRETGGADPEQSPFRDFTSRGLAPVGKMLAWIGVQGPRAILVLIVISIALPPLGGLLRPFIPEAIFLLLSIAIMQLDTTILRAHLGKPLLIVAVTAWTTLVVPTLFAAGCIAFGVDSKSPDLFLGLVLQGVGSPMLAAPALATLIGADSTLVLITLVSGMAVTPLTAPLFVSVFAEGQLDISAWQLALRLTVLLGGAVLFASLVRRLAGVTAIKRHKDVFSGVNIILLFVYVAALFEGLAGSFLASPFAVLGLTVLAIVVFVSLLLLTLLAFAKAGKRSAFAIALTTSQRNMALIVAAIDSTFPNLTWLYFGLSQLPLLVAPQFLRQFSRYFHSNDTV